MNVIIISIDSLRADIWDMRQIPNVYALTRAGCTFDTTIVQAPFTIPSHASMLTGLYPFNHGLRKQHGQKLCHQAETIFQYLEKRGYFTAALLGTDIFGPKQGYGAGFRENHGHSTLSNIRALLSQSIRQPFMLFLHYWDVHTPYRVLTPIRARRDVLCNLAILMDDYIGYSPNSWISRAGPHWLHRIHQVRQMLFRGRMADIKAGYRRAIRQMDRWLGGILRLLKEQNLDRSTLLVFTSDHGESFNEHGEAYQHPDGYEHAISLYETLVRVPTIIAGPGVPAGKRISAQIETVDIVPTLYEVLGFSPEADVGYLNLDGRSLSQHWQSRQSKKLTYSETRYQNRDQVMIRSEEYKLVQDRVCDQDQLFNLQSDPGETQNLVRRESKVYEQMVSRLKNFVKQHQQISSAPTEMEPEVNGEVTSRLKDLGYLASS
jgi:arylsulfatase A-like enzyme